MGLDGNDLVIRRRLVATITAFTVAHSLTLASVSVPCTRQVEVEPFAL